MRLASFALVVVVAGACGKKKDDSADPAPTGATAGDAGSPHGKPPENKPKDMLDRAPFVIQLSFVQAERSKDSHSTVVHATVIGDKLFYKLTPQGAHKEKRESFELMNVALSAEEVTALKQSVTDKNLLTVKSIRAADAPSSPSSSVRADLKVRIDDQRNTVTVTGALRAGGQATALAETDSYRSVVALANDLRRIADSKKPPK